MTRLLGFVSLALLLTLGLAAEEKTKTIVYEVRVYAWSFTKGLWYVERLIKKTSQTLACDGRLILEVVEDAEGRLIEKTVFSYGKDSFHKLTYDARNELVRKALVKTEKDFLRETVLTPQGEVLFYLIHFLDRAGRPLQEEYRSADDKLIYARRFSYDEAGNLVRIEVCNPDGRMVFEISYSYEAFDDQGQWLLRSEYYSYADVHHRPHEQILRILP